jgi:hypothetical protein
MKNVSLPFVYVHIKRHFPENITFLFAPQKGESGREMCMACQYFLKEG